MKDEPPSRPAALKGILFFLLKLVTFSLLLAPLLPWCDLGERFVLVFLTSGALPVEQTMKPLFYVSAVKLFPFFALILATPRLTLRRRATGIAVALSFYLLMDLFIILVWRVAPFQKPDPTMTHIIATNVWDMAGKWLLPFLLWFVLVWRRMGEFLSTKPQGGDPSSQPVPPATDGNSVDSSP